MKKKLSVGVMIGNVNAEFSYEMAYGVSKFFDEHNIDSTVLMSGTMSNSIKQLEAEDIYFSSVYEYYKALDIDALIITYASIIDLQSHNYSQKFLEKFKDIPYVLLQDNYSSKNVSNVLVDNKPGLVKLLEHLIIDHKYKKILFLSGPIENYDARERLDVFKETMKNYHLEVNSKTIEYGDYTSNVSKQINALLDNNPDAEAIVCANDTMAIASYDILASRGLKVGKDIAVTGFDDLAPASIVQPSLSTVSQDAVGMGFEAGRLVTELLLNKPSQQIVLDTSFVKRNSCGCSETIEEEEEYENTLDNAVRKLAFDIHDKSRVSFDPNNMYHQILAITKTIIKLKDSDKLIDEIKTAVVSYVNKSILYRDVITDLVEGIFDICVQFDKENKDEYVEVLLKIQKWLYNYLTREIERSAAASQDKFAQSSYLLRNAFNMELTRKEIFLKTFEQFKSLGVKSSYVYLNDGNIKCFNKEEWKCPNSMSLVAYFDEKETKYFEKKDYIRYRINEKKIDSNKNKNTLVFSLYSKESQYGFIVVEAPFNATDVIQMLCTQLNTLLFFNEIQRNEKRVRNELQETMEEIEKKNEILNNISMYDELTQIYNRRGLLENAIDFINKHNNNVQIIFCDLDHLKEINDTFGHKEGDFAIKHIAEVLKKNLPKDSIVGRIGGDEFVAIYSIKNNDKNTFIKKIKDSFAKFNEKSDKDYYIEASIGKVDYKNYSNKVDISELINEADKVLYEEKKKRRETIIK